MIGILNPVLIERQGLVPADCAKLTKLHERKETIFQFARFTDVDTESGLSSLKHVAGLLEELEFEMQETWKFDKDRNKHSWWCLLPGCECNPRYNGIFPVRDDDTPCKIHT